MDIVSAMTEINTRLGALVITSPIQASVLKVWDPVPPDSVANPDTPCWMLSRSLVSTERSAGFYYEKHTLRLQLFIKDADRDRAFRIARAFEVALHASFGPHPTLSLKVADQFIRGGTPTEATLERAGQSYTGLDLYMDITIKNPMTFDVN